MNVLVLDDERASLVVTKKLLNTIDAEISDVYLALTFSEAKSILLKEKIDTLILDIKMPEGTGYDFLDQINFNDYNIFVLSAHRDHAVEAFKYGVIDYLLKPVRKQNLQEAFDKLKVTDKVDSEAVVTRITLKEDGEYNFYPLEVILYIKAEGPNTIIHLEDGTNRLSNKSIGSYEEFLQKSDFYRIHHSYLVNLKKVLKFNVANNEVMLSESLSVPLSVRKKPGFTKAIRGIVPK